VVPEKLPQPVTMLLSQSFRSVPSHARAVMLFSCCPCLFCTENH
jgi:hypothetical protein